MGVMGWTHTQTLDTPPYLIVAAVNARYQLIRDILEMSGLVKFDTDEPEPEPVPARKLSPALFDALFAGRK